MADQQTTDHYRDGLPQRLRGEWATLTMNETADTWALRREAAAEIERLRSRLLKSFQHDNNCDQTGHSCNAAAPCGCILEAEAWQPNG